MKYLNIYLELNRVAVATPSACLDVYVKKNRFRITNYEIAWLKFQQCSVKAYTEEGGDHEIKGGGGG